MKVYSIHPMTNDVKSLLRYLRLDGSYDLVWDEKNPDILIASEWIYYKKACFDQFRALFDVARIKVMMAYEAISPDWNLFDYAIGFDDRLQNDDRFVRTVSPFILFNGFVTKQINEIETIEEAKMELATKTGFCNFLYSNPNAHPMRDRLFFELSKYKTVDSLGRHLNNVADSGTGYEGHSHECVSIKRKYKFSIASENAVYSGYTSEKLLTSLEAHTVPIYFGNPNVKEDINPEAFIDVSDFDSVESLVAYVREIDNNDELWCKYVSAPWLTREQVMLHKKRNESNREKLEWLLTGDVVGKERLAIGTHQSHYRRHFFENAWHCDYAPASPSYKYYVKKLLKGLGLRR